MEKEYSNTDIALLTREIHTSAASQIYVSQQSILGERLQKWQNKSFKHSMVGLEIGR